MNNASFNSLKFLTKEEDDELGRILSKYTNRDTLMLLLLRKFGMRSCELLSLTRDDINFSEKTIRVPGAKGSESREFPVPLNLFIRIVEESDKSAESKIFPINRRTLCRVWDKYRPVKKGIHSLRHTCAVQVYKKEKDIQLVQRILGHRDLKNTLIYQQFCYSQDDYRRVLF